MEIKTKFNLDDKVCVVQQQVKDVERECPVCKGKGKVFIVGSELKAECPQPGCWDGVISEREPKKYRIVYTGVIGQIRTEVYAEGYDYDTDLKIGYMLDTTGIGSGSIWDEECLFSSRKEAKSFCDKMNKKEKQNVKG